MYALCIIKQQNPLAQPVFASFVLGATIDLDVQKSWHEKTHCRHRLRRRSMLRQVRIRIEHRINITRGMDQANDINAIAQRFVENDVPAERLTAQAG